MKRAVIAMALVMSLVFGAHAAAVNWMSGTLGAWKDDYPAGTVVSYILGVTPGDFISDLENGMDLASALGKNDLTVDASTTIIDNAFVANVVAGQAKTDFAPGSGVPGFGVIFSAAGDAFLFAENTSGVFSDAGTNALMSMMNQWQEYQVIPEPTSFALLGLGAVVFALRRRRAS